MTELTDLKLVRMITSQNHLKTERFSYEFKRQYVVWQKRSQHFLVAKKVMALLRVDNAKHRIWIDGDEVNMTITEYANAHVSTHQFRQAMFSWRPTLEVWELPPPIREL